MESSPIIIALRGRFAEFFQTANHKRQARNPKLCANNKVSGKSVKKNECHQDKRVLTMLPRKVRDRDIAKLGCHHFQTLKHAKLLRTEFPGDS
jgi:hypothetical protein